jgi:hypothetical protein
MFFPAIFTFGSEGFCPPAGALETRPSNIQIQSCGAEFQNDRKKIGRLEDRGVFP